MTGAEKAASAGQVVTGDARATTRAWTRFIVVGLILSTLMVYVQVGRHEFVNYDDPDYVTENPHVREGLTWASVRWAFTSGHASNWHPLTWISHMFDWQLFGENAGAHHMTNLAFHIANTVLLFFLLRRLTGAQWRSAFVAALFALHPLHVESVAWVSERKDVLSTFFLFLMLMAYAGYCGVGWRVWRNRRTGEDEGRQVPKKAGMVARGKRSRQEIGPRAQAVIVDGWRRPYYWLALVLFVMGLMSKPMLVTAPFVMLLLDFWPLRRIDFAAREWRTVARRLLLEKIPFFALALAASVITYLVQQKGGAVSTSISLGARIENALVSYVSYLRKTVWPSDLSVLYPHPASYPVPREWPIWQVAGSVLVLAGVTALVLSQWRKRPYLPVGWLCFVGTLVPVIGLVQVGIQSMADRYTYIPLLGIFICLAWIVTEMVPAGPNRAKILGSGAAIVLVCCALLAKQQVQYWQNGILLFTRAVQVTDDNYLAYNNLGHELSKRGRAAEAMTNYARSLEINPLYVEALNNIGLGLEKQKQYAEAVPYYERALKVRPEHVEVHNNLGNALSELGRLDEAIEHYRFVLDKKPEHANAHNNLGIALAMKGRLDEAVGHFEKAIQFKKNYTSAHSNLGNAYAVQRKLNEAVAQYKICLELNKGDAQAHNNLGNVLAEQGHLDEAIGHYEKALRLNADNPEAHFNLGYVLRRKGRLEEAMKHFEEALRLKPAYAEARRQLEELNAAK